MMMNSRVPYIHPNGRLTRDPPRLFTSFSRKRFGIILTVIVVLALTNPGNGNHGYFPPSWWKHTFLYHSMSSKSYTTQSWWHFIMNRDRKVTNYGLFSLENIQRDSTIQISGLLSSAILCRHNSDNEISNTFCEFIGKTINQS
jgi:hypothetical protein